MEHSKSITTTDVEPKIEPAETFGIADDSLDAIGPPSVGSDNIPAPVPTVVSSTSVSTPVSTKKPKHKGKLVTGYIVYSSEVRKDRAQNNPDCTFGDISRMVGNEWRNMTAQEKQYWEEKASKSNEESAAKYAEEHGCSSPIPQAPQTFQAFLTAEPIPNQLFECCWEKCDYQFEDPMDCVDHCIAENSGHVNTYYKEPPISKNGETDYTCMWRGCIRKKKQNIIPFTHLQRLIKHVREVHIIKSGRVVFPHDRNKNYTPSKKNQVAIATSQPPPTPQMQSPVAGNTNAAPQQQQQAVQQPQQQVQTIQGTKFVKSFDHSIID